MTKGKFTAFVLSLFLFAGCASIHDGSTSLGPEVRTIHAMSEAEAWTHIAGRTVRIHDPAPQNCIPIFVGKYTTFSCYSSGSATSRIIYFSPGGLTFTWHSGNVHIASGLWELARKKDRYRLCFWRSDDRETAQEAEKDKKGQPAWRCSDLSAFASRVREVGEGDLFQLTVGGRGEVLPNKEKSFASITANDKGSVEIEKPPIAMLNALTDERKAALWKLTKSHQVVTDFLVNFTVLTFDAYGPYCPQQPCVRKNGHGTRIIFHDEGGKGYLWYPGLTRAFGFEWRVSLKAHRYDICIRYRGGNSGQTKGKNGDDGWRCGDFNRYVLFIQDMRKHDVFGLASGKLPFTLPRGPTCFAALIEKMEIGDANMETKCKR